MPTTIMMQRILIGTFTVLLFSSSAQAATFQVTKAEDTADGKCDADCSLREAVIDANKTAEPDKIALPDGTYKFDLFGQDDSGQLGDLDVSTEIEIVGNPDFISNVTIDGRSKSRVFDVFNSAGKLALRNLKITGGNSNNGACILVTAHGSITLSNVGLFLCKATEYGGAIALFGANDSTISKTAITISSSDTNGGAVWASNSTLTIDNSQMNSNSALNGGAIAFQDATVSITASSFNGNTATTNGGAIFMTGPDAKLTLQSVTLDHNKALSGGGLYQGDGILTMAKSSIYANSVSGNGGGLHINGKSTVTSSSILGNEALPQGSGGGIYVFNTGVLGLTNVTVKRNVAAEGAGIYGPNDPNALSLQNSLIINNFATVKNEFQDLNSGAISKGHNLIGIADATLVQAQATDKFGADKSTETGSVVEGKLPGSIYASVLSLANGINKGDCNVAEKDQLGNARVGICDVGAVEAICGDKIVQPVIGEECEDGNALNTDACLNTCKVAKCGDGAVQAGVEVCDDGNAIDDDDCPNSCTSPTCGDKIVQKGKNETCDDGNLENADACLNSCIKAKCGDGIVQKDAEECDDGNVKDGDLCSAVCKVEPIVDNKAPPVDVKKPIGDAGVTDGGTVPLGGTNTPGGDTSAPGGGDTPEGPASTPAAASGGGCSLVR